MGHIITHWILVRLRPKHFSPYRLYVDYCVLFFVIPFASSSPSLLGEERISERKMCHI
jgi:hypothetical protein